MQAGGKGSDSVVSIGIGKSVYDLEGSVAVGTVLDDTMDIDGDNFIRDDEEGQDFVFDLAALHYVEYHSQHPQGYAGRQQY